LTLFNDCNYYIENFANCIDFNILFSRPCKIHSSLKQTKRSILKSVCSQRDWNTSQTSEPTMEAAAHPSESPATLLEQLMRIHQLTVQTTDGTTLTGLSEMTPTQKSLFAALALTPPTPADLAKPVLKSAL
jgi:hypothetical protein